MLSLSSISVFYSSHAAPAYSVEAVVVTYRYFFLCRTLYEKLRALRMLDFFLQRQKPVFIADISEPADSKGSNGVVRERKKRSAGKTASVLLSTVYRSLRKIRQLYTSQKVFCLQCGGGMAAARISQWEDCSLRFNSWLCIFASTRALRAVELSRYFSACTSRQEYPRRA